MANVDIDPFSKHGKTGEQPDTGKVIPFTPGGVIGGGSTWEPERETSFSGMSQRMEVLKEHVKVLSHVLPKETDQTPEITKNDLILNSTQENRL